MRSITVQKLLEIVGGELDGSAHSGRRKVSGISTDTRSLKKGEAFVAIRGEKFDGHDYVSDVKNRAQVAIVSADWHLIHRRKRRDKLPWIVVRDPLEAYGKVANWHRRKFDIPVIAVGGSSGKTMTKDLTAEILSHKFKVHKTEKNLNNRVGVPAALLRLAPRHKAAVIEIGTNTPGEIAALCRVVEPTHGVITNIGSEHLELLGSIEGVKEEEGALFDWLAAHKGIAFQNLNDPDVTDLLHENLSVITFGRTSKADFQVKVGALNEEGAPKITLVNRTRKSGKPLEIQLRTPGKHTAMNAAAAAAIGFSVGVPKTAVKKALSSYAPTGDPDAGYARLALEYLPDGGRVLNDTYNANPDSARVALETLAGMKVGRRGKRIAVLADMAELGKYSSQEHEEVGRLIAEMKKIDIAMFFGRQMRLAYEEIALADRPAGVTSFFFRKKSKLIRVLNNLRSDRDVVLIKGSRSQAMEEVVLALRELTDK